MNFGTSVGRAPLPVDEVHRLLACAFPARKALSAERIPTGRSNTNFRVALSGLNDSFVLRLYDRDPNACRIELDVMRLVRGCVPVAECVFADPEGEICGKPYCVLRWVEGTLLGKLLSTADQPTSAAAGAAVGAVLARMGGFLFDQAGAFGADLEIAEPFGEADDVFLARLEHAIFHKGAAQALGRDLADRVWQFARQHAWTLHELTPCRSLVHADFRPNNLLVRSSDGRCEVAAVLDWENAHSGSALFDFAGLLRNNLVVHPAFERSLERSFVEHGGSLPRNWRRLTRLIDLVNLTDFIAKADRSPESGGRITALIRITLES